METAHVSYWQWATLLLLIGLLSEGWVLPAQAQRPEVRSLSYQQEGRTIVITYDLAGEEGETYEVNLLLSGNGGSTYDYGPQAVTGDIGEDIGPGPGKRIVWDVLEDRPGGLQGSGFRFKVTIDEEGSGWLYVIGGAVLAGSSTALMAFIFGGGNGGGGGGDDGGGFPNPPTPPN